MTLLDFYADWCGPCQKQDEIIDEVEAELDVEFERVDIETDDGQALAQEHGVRSLPTLLIESDDGWIRHTGLTQADELIGSIEQLDP